MTGQSTLPNQDNSTPPESINLKDENGTELRKGDILVSSPDSYYELGSISEVLVVLGFDEDEVVKYYSNAERTEGHHTPDHIHSCFDWIIRVTADGPETISLQPERDRADK